MHVVLLWLAGVVFFWRRKGEKGCPSIRSVLMEHGRFVHIVCLVLRTQDARSDSERILVWVKLFFLLESSIISGVLGTLPRRHHARPRSALSEDVGITLVPLTEVWDVPVVL